MLLHHLIPALVTFARRFDSVLLHLPAKIRRVVSRARVADSDLQVTQEGR
jgi:hypothetical protein